jgi:5-methylcytosine-specific restriction endonuclease McrA
MTAATLDPAITMHWRDWYSLQSWRRRAKHQLRIEPLCRACRDKGRITSATVADHIVPHRGDWNAFRLGELQSLCSDCHASKWSTDRRGFGDAISDDGLPIG